MSKTHTNIQQQELSNRLIEIDPKCIFAAEGDISGLEGEARMVLRVYDNEKYKRKNHPATLSIKYKGLYTNNVFGEVAGLTNPNMPIIFTCHVQGYNNGLVDMAKIYKQGDEIEGKVFPVGLSVMWKECVAGGSGKPYSNERKKELNKQRNTNAWHFKATIIPEQTLISVPDNKSDYNAKPATTVPKA